MPWLLPRLDTLRKDISLKWAIKAQLNPKHTDLFPLRQTEVNTRNRYIFREYFCRSTKYYNSAVPWMTRALNEHYTTEHNLIQF